VIVEGQGGGIMPASELQIGNRTAYFRKAIRTPNFSSDRVLARDAFQFTEIWLKRECPKALPYWQQARSYYVASRSLPAGSSPLTATILSQRCEDTPCRQERRFLGRAGLEQRDDS
jgi:hypothetical protein